MSSPPTRSVRLSSSACWLAPAAALAFGWVLCAAGPASAFERTQTCNPTGMFKCDADEEPKPISWPVRCIEYRINNDGSDDFSDDGTLSSELRGHVRDSFQSWQNPDCSDLHLVEDDLTDNAKVRYRDSKGFAGNMNLVVWRDDEWPHMSGRHSFALTSVTYSSETGRISDADIEINTAESTFTYFEESRIDETEKIDIGNALTHEVGHFIGLDHTDKPDATMAPSAKPGEIEKRTLERDDIRGLCAIYPAGDDPAQCDDPSDFLPPEARKGLNDGCGCANTRSSSPGGLPPRGLGWIAGGVLALVLLFRIANS